MDSEVLARRIAARWLLARDRPAVPQSHLPVALVASLQTGARVRGVDGLEYAVTAASPDSIILEAGPVILAFGNRGLRAYSWAYFAAPLLHWVID